MWRALGMFLLGCTGVGLIYMAARSTYIEPGNVGVVTNYWTGQNEELPPGFHCILSPLRGSPLNLPGKNKTVAEQSTVRVHTTDNIEVAASLNIRYTLENAAEMCTQKADGNVKQIIEMQAQTALSGIIREHDYNFQALSSRKQLHKADSEQAIGHPPEGESKSETRTPVRTSSSSVEESSRTISGASSPSETTAGSLFNTLSAELLTRLDNLCATWKIKINMIQLVNMKATDTTIEKQIEEASNVQFRASNSLIAASAERAVRLIQASTTAQVMQVEAQGRAKSIDTITAAQVRRMNTLESEAHITQAVTFAADSQTTIAEKLAGVTGTLVTGSNASSLFNIAGLAANAGGSSGARDVSPSRVVQGLKRRT